MLIGYFTFKIKNVFRSCGNRVCLEAVKMTLWVVEATTESSEKMKSKRAVRWHDLDKGNMDRSKNRFCSASILKRRVVKQMSIFLVQPGNT